MIHEVAVIRVVAGRESAFEAAVAEAAQVFRAAPGCRSLRLEREVEDRSCYRLVVGWDSGEHHMVDFRHSAGFDRWRALAVPFFAEPPTVRHVTLAVNAF